MTYEEAVVRICEFGDRGPWSEEFAKEMLDAIGYRGILMDLKASWATTDHAMSERVRAENSALTWAARCESLRDERDAARALADQLARALGVLGGVFSVIDWTDSDHMPFDGPVIDKAWADEVRPVLDAYEARDWRPISPPGSGLDGLLADIEGTDG